MESTSSAGRLPLPTSDSAFVQLPLSCVVLSRPLISTRTGLAINKTTQFCFQTLLFGTSEFIKAVNLYFSVPI